MKKWSKKELNSAIELLKKGCRYEEIGVKLNRTSRSIKNKLEEVGVKYFEFNPTSEKRKCLNCNKEFEVKKIEPNKFCSHSCSASYNNKRKKRKKYNDCLNCKVELKRKNSKYCDSKCQHEFERKQKFELIKNGNVELDSRWYKKYLIHIHGEKCMQCGWCEKNIFSDTIPIELEHIDGNSENNELKNLKLLCPNCHSLTPTAKSLNRGNGRFIRRQRYKEGKSY
jgi:hypothetical protein